MSKRLVVCCDGTWDQPVERSGDVITCTNVHKVAQAVAVADDEGVSQVMHYQAGVGTGKGLDRWLGGALGVGLSRNVRACYRFLVDSYEEGDQLFFFGFSRGAFTARSLAGMVRNCGILRRGQDDELFDRAFALYRDRGQDTSPDSPEAVAFRAAHSHEPGIHFIGVWDTVGALGVPFPIPFWRRLWGFHDTKLSSRVKHAYHAIAIDERRRPFRPTVWTREQVPEGQVLEQVWFSGAHKDVGGGYADPRLADIALKWMVEKAEGCDLRFQPGFALETGPIDPADAYRATQIAPDPMGAVHDSCTGVYKRMFPAYRALPYPRRKDTDSTNQTVASSAKARSERTADYASPHLRRFLEDTPDATTDVTVIDR